MLYKPGLPKTEKRRCLKFSKLGSPRSTYQVQGPSSHLLSGRKTRLKLKVCNSKPRHYPLNSNKFFLLPVPVLVTLFHSAFSEESFIHPNQA